MRDAAPYAGTTGSASCWRCTPRSTTRTPGSSSTSRSCTPRAASALGLMPDMGTFVERFPRVVSDRAVRDGGRARPGRLHRRPLRRPRRHARADGHRPLPRRRPGRDGAGPPGHPLHLPRPRRAAPAHGPDRARPGQVLRDGRRHHRVLHPLRPDRPGLRAGRLRRLPLQRVRGQPARPGRLRGRQPRAGTPPARDVRLAARRVNPTHCRKPEEAPCSTSTSSARTACAPPTRAAPAPRSRCGCPTTAASGSRWSRAWTSSSTARPSPPQPRPSPCTATPTR